MRKLALLGWLVLPVMGGAYHYGPGQDRLKLDDAATQIAAAEQFSEAGEPEQAVAAYDRALALLPADRQAEANRLRLERSKQQMVARLLPEAAADLKVLVDELEADKSSDRALLADARESLANAQYYLTWLMRLEGLGREEWEPEIEGARQQYRLLAEEAGQQEETLAQQANLESAIRLARMEPGELQGLPIPKQCQGCKSGQCKSPGKKPGKKSGNKAKDARGASAGPPPDGAGS
jgi:tetratricopeptide (TPR) repeat protein